MHNGQMTNDALPSPEDFTVPGFKAGAIAAGIRYQGRADLALIVSEVPATAAGVFTTNKAQAAPVLLSRTHLGGNTARAIVVNSGIANACTGEIGLKRALATAEITAASIDCRTEEVLVASTGVIGMELPMEPLINSLEKLVTMIRPDGWMDAARAIMTTDTVPKLRMVRSRLEDRPFTVLGIAKGAGMISPDMATLLSFVATDVAITPRALRTNDSLFVLANGYAANHPIDSLTSSDGERFRLALREVLLDLAKKVVADAEGATKFVEIKVQGAYSQADALRGARTVANSPLVKTALFGEDANWGRIIAALGRADIDLDLEQVQLFFDGVKLVENGLPVGEEAENKASQILRQQSFSIIIDLGQGEAEESVYTCDLSLDYVKINANYRS
jgi:glutamate N-acetyltransferase/amino-acid N-acetyltransferase